MSSHVLLWERIEDHGELRAFLREGPPLHLAFELLRDSDGRAWTLRVPYDRCRGVERLLREAAERLARGEAEPFDEAGMARLGVAPLGDEAEVFALLLREGGEERFALWRRERLGRSRSWTLDALFVPPAHAPELLRLLLEAIGLAARAMPPRGGPQ